MLIVLLAGLLGGGVGGLVGAVYIRAATDARIPEIEKTQAENQELLAWLRGRVTKTDKELQRLVPLPVKQLKELLQWRVSS